MVEPNFKWPEHPYKGLNFYRAEDQPLLAGRDDDVIDCAEIVADHSAQLIMLHGETGSGKSSFLRAGLIPYLEGQASGFQFMRDVDNVHHALFVRSTEEPLQRLAREVHAFAMRGIVQKTPGAERTIDLRAATLSHDDVEAYCREIGGDAKRMRESLAKLAAPLSHTLVLVIDQGEEVLTLRPGSSGDPARDAFFGFLALLSRSRLDVRIIIALRTEYYGRFRDSLQRRSADMTCARDYYLSTLDKVGLVDAIVRPTRTDPVGNYGSPYEAYHFTYGEGVASRIADDLQSSMFSGGVLPLLQIVCSRLYERTKSSAGSWIITIDDYEKLKGVEGQMRTYVDTTLSQVIRRLQPQWKEWNVARECDRWKLVLAWLVKPQADGTMTTELMLADDLKKSWKAEGCQIEFKRMMSALATDEVRLCREVTVIRRSDDVQRVELCYALGHDALGHVFQQWEKAFYVARRVRRIFFGLPLFLLATAGGHVVWKILGNSFDDVSWLFTSVVGGYGMLLLVATLAIPISRFVTMFGGKATDTLDALRMIAEQSNALAAGLTRRAHRS